jgi:hypothetical protein
MTKNIVTLVNRVTDLEKLYKLILEQKKENMNDKNNTQQGTWQTKGHTS